MILEVTVVPGGPLDAAFEGAKVMHWWKWKPGGVSRSSVLLG